MLRTRHTRQIVFQTLFAIFVPATTLTHVRRFAPRVIRPLLTVAVLLALGLVAPLHAQGYGPPPLVNLLNQAEDFIIYVLCPVGAVWLIASAALKASQGHHGAGSGIAGSVIGAVVLVGITVVRSWMRSL